MAGIRCLPGDRAGGGVTAVSLSAHDRRALDLIQEDLAAADPALAAMLSAFNRLADGEEMPGRERIREHGRRETGRSFRATLAARPGTCWRDAGTQRWVILTWLAVTLLLLTLALVASHAGSAASCASRATGPCGYHAPARQQGRPAHEPPG
jgi:hypothetical protein